MLQAFIITLREGVEAALIIGITLAYLNKIQRQDLRKSVFIALGSAFVASIGVAILLSVVSDRQCAVAVWTRLTKQLDHKKHERRILDPRPGESGKTAGLFDDDLFLYHEDMDLSWRLRLSGWRLALAPRSVVYHKYAFNKAKSKFFFPGAKDFTNGT